MQHAAQGVRASRLLAVGPQCAQQRLPGDTVPLAECQEGQEHRGLSGTTHRHLGPGLEHPEVPEETDQYWPRLQERWLYALDRHPTLPPGCCFRPRSPQCWLTRPSAETIQTTRP